ncbi:hypothetical protein ABZU75_42035 [Streptosporangium sp. NPDC005286]|uniref:hypothetical protein n=1 Tax=Streptosporangium sp. NPDC005286 TaxID=3154463 RepID=UPI0033BF3818
MTLLALGLLAALLPGPAQAADGDGQVVVQGVQVDNPTYAGLCRGAGNDVKVTVQLTYTGPGNAYLGYKVSGLNDDYQVFTHVQDQNGPGAKEILIPVRESGTRQIKVVGLVQTDNGHVETGEVVQTTINRTCHDVQVTATAAPEYHGLCGSKVTTPVKATITSPIAQTISYQWLNPVSRRPLPGSETPQPLVFAGPGSHEVTGALPRGSASKEGPYVLKIVEPAPYEGPSLLSKTNCAPETAEIASLSQLHYVGPCGPNVSTPLRARITSGLGQTVFIWTDAAGNPMDPRPGQNLQEVEISQHGGSAYADGPSLPRHGPGSGTVAILFPFTTRHISGTASWSTTCLPLATPKLTQVEFTSEEESCDLHLPATFTLKGSITALGAGTVRYAYARKSAQTNNAWVRDPWTSLTINSAGTVDVPKQWTVPISRQGETGQWRLEIDEPYRGVSSQAGYWFSCSDWP